MKTLYFDCFSGVSGNMLLGALIGLGYPVENLKSIVAALGLDESIIRVSSDNSYGFQSTLVLVENPPDQPVRNLSSVFEMIDSTDFDTAATRSAKDVFHKLAHAESKVHGTSIENIHFHEVGAIDALVDILGVCDAVQYLKVDKIICSPLPLGHGTVECAHGTLPVPVPATVELLKGYPTYSSGRKGEHVTPTGAALVTTLSDQFGRPESMTMLATAFGSGTRRFESGPPNLLRAILAKTKTEPRRLDELVVETNIDDMNPEFFGPLMDNLFVAGAKDVTFTPCQMKKNRPGILVSIICGRQTLDKVAGVLFSESTTIGIRISPVERIVCDRRWEEVTTQYGPIRIKISSHLGMKMGIKPEIEDCKKIADEKNVPLQKVCDEAVFAYRKKNS